MYETSLPQRIRAGCDDSPDPPERKSGLCHSAFARVATLSSPQSIPRMFFATAHSRGLRLPACWIERNHVYLCHSAFARVATQTTLSNGRRFSFATAHSRGLRPLSSLICCVMSSFATAHSRGLRRRNDFAH